MRKVTVTLDEKTAARAQAQAAKRRLTLARYVVEVLRWELRRVGEYEAAYRAWRASKPFPLKGTPQPDSKRQARYDRPGLPRR